MDSKNLHTASGYINNLLLSRGLLRNGTPIDFANPAKAEGGLDATMAKVMNLVHDLILRRDREADTLSNLSHNLQTARNSSLQQTQTIAHLETKNADLDRQLALSTTQENNAKGSLRSAETRTRALREEMARLKGIVAQIRAQCANDIRRRDGEIKRLKRHLEGRRGRDGTSGQVGVVVVTPGAPRSQQQSRGAQDEYTNVASPDYSLKQETTDFLTRLSQGLSDENDALIGLVRNTLATLRSLQGLPPDGGNSAHESTTQNHTEPANVTIMAPPSYEELAADADEVLEHLRGLLTNPSFVPLEEVEIRDDEIFKLREGWERMSARWKEAVSMMDGWRKRMLDTGDTINIDDLTKGMNLAVEMPAAKEIGEESESMLENDMTINDMDAEGQALVESPKAPLSMAEDDMDELAPELPLPLKADILTDRNVNIRPVTSPRKMSFPSVPEENGKNENSGMDDSLLDFSSDKTLSSPTRRKTAIAVPEWFSPPKTKATIQKKLDQAEAEAKNARTQEVQKDRKDSAVRRVNKRLKGSRRRSTLSPEELENLLGAV